MAVIETKALSKKYGRIEAVKDLDLSLEKGQIVGLLGPNGSGKTTLIKMINGLLTPSSGELYIKGFKPGVETKLAVSYLPERNSLPEWMKVKELIDMFVDFYPDFRAEKAYKMLADLDIDVSRKLKNLSKGNREKVQLILCMSRNADVYALDEPIGGVDPAARDYILRTIIQNYNEDAVVLISTHLIADVENVLDRVLFIKNGELVLNSTVDEIREEKGKSVDALFREVFAC
ncbi:MAG: ABC transporter ATP-binding protein [Lachnospiraceae bacterium]|nr:ABC transporter ATP-binding protein [Lachnospiraceae bacterium]